MQGPARVARAASVSSAQALTMVVASTRPCALRSAAHLSSASCHATLTARAFCLWLCFDTGPCMPAGCFACMLL